MFSDREQVFGGNASFRVRENAAPSQSCAVASDLVVESEAPASPTLMGVGVFIGLTRHRVRCRTSQHIEKFSAEGLLACSVLAVFAADPNTRSPQAASTLITRITEQRCCVAA